ncbi:MAG TPA: hypothetical protein VMF06_12610 [Candidatus Limnocylindria bacterium]|jgi:hypothetical protein|nr:hypothetical protein [Candidatus Limnocylindria bacterium]
MIQNVLGSSEGIALYGIASVCLFFFVFGSALLWSLLLKSSFLKSMESLPLSDGEIGNSEEGEARHE